MEDCKNYERKEKSRLRATRGAIAIGVGMMVLGSYNIIEMRHNPELEQYSKVNSEKIKLEEDIAILSKGADIYHRNKPEFRQYNPSRLELLEITKEDLKQVSSRLQEIEDDKSYQWANIRQEYLGHMPGFLGLGIVYILCVNLHLYRRNKKSEEDINNKNIISKN